MKSFWISCVARSSIALALVCALALPGAAEAKKKPRPREELTNFLLGSELSLWLVGAIGRMATEQEIDRYLGLTADDEAEAFIEEFWSRRHSAESVWPAKQPRGIYEVRAGEADRLFTEGARLGRHSDRGIVHILYGEPAEVKYEVASRPGIGAIEVWVYPKKAEKGLDGKSPKRQYFFAKQGEFTVETAPPTRRRLRPSPFG